MSTKKNSGSYSDDAYRRIKQLILNQELVPGQKLIYDDLAKRLDMSRTPIINALNRLEQHGLVVSESHRGFTVKPMDTKEAWDTFGFREAIETYAVEQAILKADPVNLKVLEEKLQEYEAYQPNYYDRKKIFLDAAFHMQIAEMTDNDVLKWHLKLNLQHVYLRANLNNYSVDRMNAASAEHRQLFRKIESKDVLGAAEIIRNHLQRDKSHIIACMSENERTTENFDL
jgi:DNA-binding GntR family transcriptional regulator